MSKRTKIVATIGPASENTETLVRMMHAGMDVARLNFSHGSYDNHALLIRRVREAAATAKKRVAIMQDLQGPRIRLGAIGPDGIEVKKGDQVLMVHEADVARLAARNPKQTIVPVGFADLYRFAIPGKHILISDGIIDIQVQSVKDQVIYGTVAKPGVLHSHKGINMPGASIDTDAITKKDKQDLKFGLTQGIDFVALSFVREAADVHALRKLIGKKPVRIVAKIEREEALENFDEILEATDGVMVARGDLGIEIPPEDVPMVQKDIVKKCLIAGKPVIVATQMLESMITNPRPTRAEVSDVANAVIDHTDAVMLSGESAFGKYPVEAVQMMNNIIEKTERSKYDAVPLHYLHIENQSVEDAMSAVANDLSAQSHIKAIVIHSVSGKSAGMVARHRPRKPVIAFTSVDSTAQQLSLTWGVHALPLPQSRNIDELLRDTSRVLKKAKMVKKGEYIVLVSGELTSSKYAKRGGINMVKIHQVQ